MMVYYNQCFRKDQKRTTVDNTPMAVLGRIRFCALILNFDEK